MPIRSCQRRRTAAIGVCSGFLFLLQATSSFAQVTGSIVGTVRDSSGGVLPGAIVTVKSPALQRASASVTTDADGTYRVLLLPPGTYEVSVDLSGFSSRTRQRIDVLINQQTTLDFTLSVAGVAEAVTVSSSVPVIDVARSDVTESVSQRTIDSLPLNGRNFTDLLALVPGAKPDPTLTSTTNVEIFGERASAVSYLVDGAENNDPVNGGAQVRYTQDSIREFEVITTGYAAEFGRAQGGVANIITRSGTDSFDGRAFWFTRNDKLDSNNIPPPSPLPANYVEPTPPQLQRYQWGGTLGGPIVKDKAFFFGSFERLNETRGVNFDLTKIPAFVLNGLATPSHAEDFGIAPHNLGFTGNFKYDMNLNQANRLTASVDRSTLTNNGLISSPVAGTIAMPSAAATVTTPATNAIVRETFVAGSATFLESTAHYIRGETGNNLDQTQRSEPLLMLLRSGFIQTTAPFGGQTDQIGARTQVSQSLSHFVSKGGDHELKVGWDFSHISFTGSQQVTNDVEYSPAYLAPNQAGVFTQNFTNYGFQQSAARFFTLSANPDGSLNTNIVTNDISFFAQDRWQATPDVTVNAGLRYDYSSLFGGYKKAFGPRTGVAWDVGGRHKTVVKVDYGLFFDRNLLIAASSVPDKGGVFTKQVFDVALPRLGVDYTNSLIDYVITSGFPTASVGFGPPENPLYNRFAADLRQDPLALYKALGISVTDATHAPVVTADNVQQLSGMTAAQVVALLDSKYPGTDFRFFDVPGGSILGNRVLSFFPRGPLDATRIVSQYSSDMVPFTNAFNAGVDQQLPRDIGLSVTYVHRRSRDLLTRRTTNLYDVPPGNPNFGKTTDGGPQISAVTYDGLIDYDGVIVALRKRFTSRYQLGVSYTGSRARDNLLAGTSSAPSMFTNGNHPEYDYGPSNQSAPHIFVANGIVLLPLDINLSGVAFWRSGAAFNPRGLMDTTGSGLVDQRDLSVPRNSFRTSAYADLDVRAEKKVFLGRHAASFLVEAFNLFNRANVASVSNVSGPQFGTPVAYFPGREVQLGLRYFLNEGR
ncbi:MAG TPA: carboxypeptidase regulatory-like domain-containing protein [Vicinamibacterales bacterium]|nr:carboxypeptidase regulatory-like domain-containing protein [Vicinamibacterales bacterium]